MVGEADGGGAPEGEAVLLDHWIYGRPRTAGYRVMAVAEGLNLTLYEAKLLGHYTPLRGVVSESVDRKVTDIRMVHPVPDSDELILSVLKPGLPDEAGRDTYVNHSIIAPLDLLRQRRLTLPTIDAAVRAWDADHPGVEGSIAALKVPLEEDPSKLPPLGAGLRKLVSRAAAENVANRWANVRDGRTLLYLPKSEDAARVEVLYQLLEVLCFGGKLKVPVSMSDVPPVSQLEPFQVVVSARGIRADQRWALVEANAATVDAPRSPGLAQVYPALDAAYKPTTRIVGTPKGPSPTPPGPGPPSGAGSSSGPTSDPASSPPSSVSPTSPPPSPPSPPAPSAPSTPRPEEAPSAPAERAPSVAPAARAASLPPARVEATTSGSPVDSPPSPPPSLEEAHRRVADAFAGFVGNAGAVERISIDLVSALTSVPPRLASSYMITGNPSTGKTTLAQTMAKALGVPLVLLDGQSVADREALLSAVEAALRAQGARRRTLPQAPQGVTEYEYPPVLVFIDEVQLVPRRTQEALLTLTEPDTRYVRLESGIHRFPYATFVAATTRPQSVDRALRSRFNPEVHLNDYTREEVAEILRLRYPSFPEDIRLRLAVLGQLIPRVSLRLAHDLDARCKVSLDRSKGVEDHLADLERAEGLDAMGFGPLHRKVLQQLQAQNGPMGLDALLNVLGESDRLYVEREVLAGLQRAGLIMSLPTGRAITPSGADYLERPGGRAFPTPPPEEEAGAAPPGPERGSGGAPGAEPAGAVHPSLGSSRSVAHPSGWSATEPFSVLETPEEVRLWKLAGAAGLAPERLLGFTHEAPEQVRSVPGLAGISLIQITHVEGDLSVSPTELERIGSLIERHLGQGPGRAVVLPGVDTLVQANSLPSVRRLLEIARDLALSSQGALLCSLAPGSLTADQVQTLERNSRRIS